MSNPSVPALPGTPSEPQMTRAVPRKKLKIIHYVLIGLGLNIFVAQVVDYFTPEAPQNYSAPSNFNASKTRHQEAMDYAKDFVQVHGAYGFGFPEGYVDKIDRWAYAQHLPVNWASQRRFVLFRGTIENKGSRTIISMKLFISLIAPDGRLISKDAYRNPDDYFTADPSIPTHPERAAVLIRQPLQPGQTLAVESWLSKEIEDLQTYGDFGQIALRLSVEECELAP